MEDDRLFTVEDVCNMLSVKPLTIYRWVKSGKLKGYNVGGKALRFKREDIDELLTSSRVDASPEE